MRVFQRCSYKNLYYAPEASAYSGKIRSGACVLSRIRSRFRGSLTLEAAMGLSLFLLFILAVMSFFMILRVQLQVQSSMEDVSRRMGKSAYLLQRAEGTAGDNGSVSAGAVDEDASMLQQAGINPATIQIMLLSDGNLRRALEHSRVRGGAGGLYTYASTFSPDTGILDMLVSYDYQVPWLSGWFDSLRLVQRMRSHVWTGDPLQQSADGSGTGSEKVYVTPTGTVYHTSPDCHYLDLSIHSVSRDQAAQMRNASGAKYYPCEECAGGAGTDTVYITDYGTSWHSSLGCSGLKRTVQEVDMEEVGDMRICSKCAEHGGHVHEK